MAERFLERPIRSALDIGCGEGRWRAELLRLRPQLCYQGVEPSPYAVKRFGERRNILHGGFADLPELGLGGPVRLGRFAPMSCTISKAMISPGACRRSSV